MLGIVVTGKYRYVRAVLELKEQKTFYISYHYKDELMHLVY